MIYNAFDIVVVPFPFTDQPVVKKRPALVVSTHQFNTGHDQLILAMITTAGRSHWPSDIPVQDWAKAGLSVPCYIRLKLFTLEQNLIIRRVGQLSKLDRTAIQTVLNRYIAGRE